MSKSTQTTVTPLTSEQENLLYDEMDKVEERLAQVLKDLDIKVEDIPDMVDIAKDMKNPKGDDLKFINDVREGQKCQQNLKDIEVTHLN